MTPRPDLIGLAAELEAQQHGVDLDWDRMSAKARAIGDIREQLVRDLNEFRRFLVSLAGAPGASAPDDPRV